MIPAKIALIIPRLATEHVGELVATRDAITRTLQAAGLDWHDIAAACAATSSPSPFAQPAAPPARSGHSPRFGDLARATRDLDRGRLTPRERLFVAAMVRRGFAFQPSPRQAEWLASIFDRLQSRAAA